MFIFVLFYCGLYFWAIRDYEKTWLTLFPPFCIYIAVSALQFNVGSDYTSYISIYENQWVLDKYYDSKEFFFYYLNVFLNYMKSPPQMIFVVFSIVQSFWIFLFFKRMSKIKVVLWLFFVIFFTTTNIYNNQLNGIRQYAVLTLFPYVTFLVAEKKYIRSLLFLILGITFHSSAYILFSIYIIRILSNLFNKRLFFIFCLSFLFYFVIGNYTLSFLQLIGSKYSLYSDSIYFEAMNISTVITKIYYLPVFMLFFLLRRKRTVSNNFFDSDYFNFALFIFASTYWSFLLSLDIGILSRVAIYFWFFIIFPIYYVIRSLWILGDKKLSIIVFVYTVMPYFAKVTFFAKGEFLYHSYIFN
nr:EpsG family protein [Photobacterium carnosum]